MQANTTKEQAVDFDALPDSAYLRAKQVAGPILPITSATLYNWAKAGRIKPVKISARVTGWRVGDIRALLASQAGA